ncbi:MAG TPA: potassium transporter TrkG, partial [Actinomycetes bacterium]|nr:potassium transporter TrkG [Actinomycetes bacterium]
MFPRSLLDTVRRRRPRHPAQRVAAAFAVGILVGTLLLLLPYARAGPGAAPLHVATFTATSAVCVTGLTVVDTATYWSTLGQVIILLLVQVGGLGFMVLASLLALAMSRRLGLRQRLLAQTEINVTQLGETRRVLLGVAAFSLLFEVLAAAVLTGRLWLGYGEPFGRAAWYGLFHSVSAFNNAGFALYSDNLVGFVDDGWVSLTVTLAVIAGGLGFPVLIELLREPARPGRWSLHTKMTLTMTWVLLAAGTLAILAFEWSNPATLGRLDLPGKLLTGFFHGASPRSAGFNTVDYAEMAETSWLVTEVLMFIGAGSAGTSGGIRVTTFAVLAMMVVAEARGLPTVSAFGRRIPEGAQRQALSVALIGLGAVVAATLAITAQSGLPLSRTLFEAFSAFGTVGLSTGITPQLPLSSQNILILLMFLGRTGPVTLATALTFREREPRYRYPEDR